MQKLIKHLADFNQTIMALRTDIDRHEQINKVKDKLIKAYRNNDMQREMGTRSFVDANYIRELNAQLEKLISLVSHEDRRK